MTATVEEATQAITDLEWSQNNLVRHGVEKGRKALKSNLTSISMHIGNLERHIEAEGQVDWANVQRSYEEMGASIEQAMIADAAIQSGKLIQDVQIARRGW